MSKCDDKAIWTKSDTTLGSSLLRTCSQIFSIIILMNPMSNTTPTMNTEFTVPDVRLNHATIRVGSKQSEGQRNLQLLCDASSESGLPTLENLLNIVFPHAFITFINGRAFSQVG
ncbi:hypothetical protein AB6A40_009097 [Gnathostoma spinigerum]|uniref:Uncharacterized protein n=1 Tax=Gnathostoma spinigerum TaxID=75299 RepID=A0ABD6ER13_9BILA